MCVEVYLESLDDCVYVCVCVCVCGKTQDPKEETGGEESKGRYL